MIISLVNQKGGVGKTTIAINLTFGLSKKHKVLLVDGDPLGSCLQWQNISDHAAFFKLPDFISWFLKPVHQNFRYSIHTSVFHPLENLTYQYDISNNLLKFGNLHILIVSAPPLFSIYS